MWNKGKGRKSNERDVWERREKVPWGKSRIEGLKIEAVIRLKGFSR